MRLSSPYRRRLLQADWKHSPLRPAVPWQAWLWCATLGLIASQLWFLAAAGESMTARHWTLFSAADGPPSSDIRTLLVDGPILWVGTASGVARYDGRWTPYPNLIDARTPPPRNVATLPFGKVTALTGGEQAHELWAGTQEGRIAGWNGSAWRAVAELAAPVRALFFHAGQLWVATERGLLRVSPRGNVAALQMQETDIHTLARTSDRIWVGTRHGLLGLDPRSGESRRIPLLNELGENLSGGVSAIWVEDDDHIWLGLAHWLVGYHPSTGEISTYLPFDLLGTQISGLAGIPGKELWVTSNSGAAVRYIMQGDGLTGARTWSAATQDGFEPNSVRDVAIDQDGSIWFAADVGVYRYQPWAWTDLAPTADDPVVNDILRDSRGRLWVATRGAGVWAFDDLDLPPVHFGPTRAGLPSAVVCALAEDASGGIWAGTIDGVARYDGVTWTVPVAPAQLPAPIACALQPAGTDMWIGTARGLVQYDGARHTVQVESQTEGQAINDLVYDSLGRLWAATAQGKLWQKAPGSPWTDMAQPDIGAPGGAPVTRLAQAPNLPGAVIAAFYGAGIYQWANERWTSRSVGQQRTGGRVFALFVDPTDGSLWIGSETGVCRMDALGCTHYDARDGIQTGAIRAIVAIPQGGFLFGGTDGLSFYRQEETPPWLEVTNLQSEGAKQAGTIWQVRMGTPLMISVAAGDLQTGSGEVRVYYRIHDGSGSGDWMETQPGTLDLEFPRLGGFAVELVARDASLNYSQPWIERFEVIPKPALVTLPLLGEVEMRILRWLILFGTLAVTGFSYVLFELIARRLSVVRAIERGFNPYISGEPVRSEEMFFGRRELLEQIVSTLHNNSIMIHGERRIGKTSILYQLAKVLRQIDDKEFWFVPVFIDLEGTSQERLFRLLSEEIATAVAELPNLGSVQLTDLRALRCHGEPDVEYTDREFSRDLRAVLQVLDQYGKRHHGSRSLRLILLLDEMDTLSRFDHVYQQQLRRMFMRDFAATVGAVVAGIQISKDWDRVESPWFNMFNEVAMQPFSQDQALELLTEPVRGYYSFQDAALEFILRHSDGRPYRIQQYALEAVNHMLRHGRRRILMVDVLAAHELVWATVDTARPTQRVRSGYSGAGAAFAG
jgi:ligand-binding sensor domain-containing protein